MFNCESLFHTIAVFHYTHGHCANGAVLQARLGSYNQKYQKHPEVQAPLSLLALSWVVPVQKGRGWEGMCKVGGAKLGAEGAEPSPTQ